MKKLFFLITLFTSMNVIASDFFYCDKTTSYVYLGDSLDHVKELCGAPTKESTKTIVPQETREILQYIYNFQPHVVDRLYKPNALVVDFVDDKIVKIQVEGTSVEETDYCGSNRLFKIGDKRQYVFYCCRKPSIIRTFVEKVDSPSVEETIFVYQEDEYTPPTTFYFHDGKLVEIK